MGAVDVDAKLKQKYAFLFKPREEMKPDERRWKWVRKDCLPPEMQAIFSPQTKVPSKKHKERDEGGDDEDKEKEEVMKETVLKLDNFMELDYSDVANVHETMKKLKEERRSTKFKQAYHV